MYLAVSLLLAGAAAVPVPSAKRAAWYDCLNGFAQIQMLGRESDASIALRAMGVCVPERDAFQVAARRAFRQTPKSNLDQDALDEILTTENRKAVLRTIAFVDRIRQLAGPK